MTTTRHRLAGLVSVSCTALVVVAWSACGTAELEGYDCPVPAQLVAGTTLTCGGQEVVGTMLRGDLPACSATVTTDCVTDAAFAAGDVTRLVPETFRINAMVAGVVGNLTPRVVRGAYALCTAEGETDCIAVVDFVAIDTTSLAPKVATGSSIGPVAGTGIPQPAKACVSNVQVGCYATAKYPADAAKSVARCILSDPLSLRFAQ